MLENSTGAVALEERREELSPPQQAPAHPERRDAAWARWEVLAYLLIVSVALGLRLWDLGAKALHHDESLHALYAWYLYEGRGYRHDPMMHGPFQFFGTAAFSWLLWASDFAARLLPALFGTALVALPMMLRRYLGSSGALVTSVLLALSPSMLYFSRFARNDIYMAVWALSLVGFMWRYLDSGKVRYLVGTSLVLALAFATKETAYIMVAVLGSYLFVMAATDVVPWLLGRKKLREFSRTGGYFILVATLSLPLWGAAAALFQKPVSLTLANPDWNRGPVGVPIGTGLYVAFFIQVTLLLTAVVIGLRWRPRVWLVGFGAFAAVWGLLYSSFFTYFPGGLLSGLWRSMGYWVVQQEVARGGQPWYYYLVLGLNYEFLALLMGSAALVYFLVKGDAFARFLCYWAVANLALYSYASEKMPWLLVGVALPFFLLAGKLLGHLLERRPWQRTLDSQGAEAGARGWLSGIHWSALAFTGMMLLFLAVTGRWLLIGLERDPGLGMGLVLLLAFLVLALAGACVYLLRRTDGRQRVALVGVSLAGALLALSVPSAFRVAYANADVPVEMLVYTQTAPDIPRVMAEIERLGKETGKGRDLKITVDSTDGFSWPWAWYLRDYRSVGYPCLSDEPGCRGLDQPPDADVVLLATRNQSSSARFLSSYGAPVAYKHRWWFPESYRGLTPTRVWESMRTKKSWCKAAEYFVYREFGLPVGSVDSYAYFPKDFTPVPVERKVTSQGTRC